MIKINSGKEKEEKSFHDNWASNINLDKLNPYLIGECVVIPESIYSIEQLGNIKGKKVLDLGCGSGETSVYLALKGAEVQAVDISPEMIEITKKLAEKHGVKNNVSTDVGNLEAMNFPENTYDAVYGQDILHHLDFEIIFPKIHKTLKNGGIAVFSEPLAENFIINLLRRLTPNIRTTDEHPFKIKDIKKYGGIFSKYEYKCFQLFTLAIFFWMYLSEIFKKKKSRYWKKIIEEYERYKQAFLILQNIDNIAFKIFPFLRKYGRMVVMKFTK